jgi:hypothetical protein
MVDAADVDVVHVEQQLAATPPDQFADELPFAHLVVCAVADVAGDVLEHQWPAEHLLHLLHTRHEVPQAASV